MKKIVPIIFILIGLGILGGGIALLIINKKSTTYRQSFEMGGYGMIVGGVLLAIISSLIIGFTS